MKSKQARIGTEVRKRRRRRLCGQLSALWANVSFAFAFAFATEESGRAAST